MRNTSTILRILFSLFCIVGSASYSLVAQQRKQIVIEKADRMRNLKHEGQDIRRLIGNVAIRHEDVIMHCDSAYDYTSQSRFDAFGNVVVFQESSTLYGDTLHYNSDTKQGRVRGKIVRLVDEDASLITNFLDFNTNEQKANFFGGGIITTDSAHFSSKRGIYFSRQKLFAFAENVAYKDKDIVLNTDSLQYNTRSETIWFYGPTRVYNDNNYAYGERGWYNRRDNITELQQNAFVDNGEQRVFGERIYYNKQQGFAEIEKNGCIIDTAQRLTLYADYIEYFEHTEFGEASKNPLVLSISEEGDTLYLRADKLIGNAIRDSVKTDSTLFHLMKGIGDVRFYRQDIQGICDSMIYHSTDSLLTMYVSPIIWNEENQLSSDKLDILFKNETINRMYFNGSAFICSQEDSIHFNQIRGKEMEGFFNAGRLTKIDVKGNGQTAYYVRDKGKLSAVNKAESSNLTINLNDNKVSSIMFRDTPKATLFPIQNINIKEVTLKGFAWQNDKRPKSENEIIPKGLNLGFYIPIENKANLFRDKKKNPAEKL
ncbi:MAG: OstA-like protein [Bacteroidales bacterium]|nr:OstA-like protein [Bacteroidales bacterium]